MDLLAHALIAGGNAVVGYDAIHANIAHLPPGAQAAGYTTGSGPVPWTAADWKAHPGAVRIDQDPGASDPAADVLDVERGAASPDDCPGWVKRARTSFNEAKRPGQRWPSIYASASQITAVVNALIAGGVTDGAGLWVANWDFTKADAIAAVLNASGPFPIVAFQHSNGPFFDVDIFSSAWLRNVSGDQPGSVKHLTRPGDTIGGLADARNMNIWAWLALQRKLSGPQAAHLVRHAECEPGSTWRSVSP